MPSFPPFSPLLTDSVGLRPAAERDIPEILIAHQDDATLYRRLGLRRPPSGAELGRRTEHSDEDRQAGVAVWLTILAAQGQTMSDECRGQVDVQEVDWDHRRAELTIWVALADRGHGLATGALSLVGPWLLRDGGMERVGLVIAPDNEPMLRAASAAGYAREGLLRGYRVDAGRRVDVVAMSMVTGDLVQR